MIDQHDVERKDFSLALPDIIDRLYFIKESAFDTSHNNGDPGSEYFSGLASIMIDYAATMPEHNAAKKPVMFPNPRTGKMELVKRAHG